MVNVLGYNENTLLSQTILATPPENIVHTLISMCHTEETLCGINDSNEEIVEYGSINILALMELVDNLSDKAIKYAFSCMSDSILPKKIGNSIESIISMANATSSFIVAFIVVIASIKSIDVIQYIRKIFTYDDITYNLSYLAREFYTRTAQKDIDRLVHDIEAYHIFSVDEAMRDALYVVVDNENYYEGEYYEGEWDFVKGKYVDFNPDSVTDMYIRICELQKVIAEEVLPILYPNAVEGSQVLIYNTSVLESVFMDMLSEITQDVKNFDVNYRIPDWVCDKYDLHILNEHVFDDLEGPDGMFI